MALNLHNVQSEIALKISINERLIVSLRNYRTSYLQGWIEKIRFNASLRRLFIYS